MTECLCYPVVPAASAGRGQSSSDRGSYCADMSGAGSGGGGGAGASGAHAFAVGAAPAGHTGVIT